MALVGLILTFAAPVVAKYLRRSRDLSAISTMTRYLNQSRLQAVKRGFNVCVQFSKGAADPSNPKFEKRIIMSSWEDRNPDFLLGTYVDAVGVTQNEVNLGSVQVETAVHLAKPGGTDDDIDSNVLFKTYGGDTSLKGLVVFTPTGGIVPPEAGDCGTPTLADGRAIYFGDAPSATDVTPSNTNENWNFFRVTIVSNLSGKPREEMLIKPRTGDTRDGYYPTDWKWK
ncbi:MAG TPA: hypothetical protein VGR00_02410 [Thermoanaerobaculia bacterium]|nr:hypothetical protein [Thermoanaerobaculia bacterium]